MKVKKSSKEQLALFDQPNAADLLIEYTSFSEEIGHAANLKILENDPGPRSKRIKERLYRALEPEEIETIEQFLKQMPLKVAQDFIEASNFLCKEAQLKIFEFPKDVIRKILTNYCKHTSWIICDEAQMKLVETFSPQEIKELCRELHLRLCDRAQLNALENFSKDNTVVVLVAATDLSVNMFEEILKRFSKEEAKELLLAFIEQGGTIWDEIQRRILAKFSPNDAKEIFLKHLEKKGFLGDEVKVKIWAKFPEDDAVEIFKKSSKAEKVISEELLVLIIDSIPNEIAYELLLNYVGNGVGLSEAIQKEIIVCFTKNEAKEILLKYKKKRGHLCPKAKQLLK